MYRFRIFVTAILLLLSNTIWSQKADRELFKNASCYYEYALKLNNDPYYLGRSEYYCELGIKTSNDTQLIASLQILKNKIALKISTCEQNMNHQFEFFSFFKGIPSTYGFADDNIEYSFEHALDDLLDLPYYTASKNVGQVNGYAILRRGNTDEEMYDINFQQLASSTNQYILPHHLIADLIGPQNLEKILSKSDTSEVLLALLCDKLGVNQIGVYEGNFIHQVDDLIQTEFRYNQFNLETGLANPLVILGYSIDKRGVLVTNVSLLLLSSLLLILLLQFLEYLFDQRNRLSLSSITSYFEWRSFKDKLLIAVVSQLLPMIIGFVLIQSLSFLTPDDAAHYLESEAILWYVTNTFVLALIPTLLSFFLVNKFNIDGFHTLRGYQIFATASLYGSLSPLFIWSIIKYEEVPHDIHLLVLLNTIFIGIVFGKSMELFFKRKRSNSNHVIGIIGTIIVTISAFITAWLLIHVLSIDDVIVSTLVSFALTVIFLIINKFGKATNRVLNHSNDSEGLTIPYYSGVLKKHALNADLLNSNSRIIVMHGVMGIGKTSYLQKVLIPYLENNSISVFYSDCDQFADKNSLHFEPFVEAFGEFLGVDEIEDKSSVIGNVSNKLPFSVIDDRIGQLLSHSGRPKEKTGEDFVIEILDKLVASKSKQFYFILEDIQWIDSETKNLVLFMLNLLENKKYKKVLNDKLKFIFTYSDTVRSTSEEDEVNWLPNIGFSIDFSNYIDLRNYILKSSDSWDYKLSNSAKISLNNVFNEVLDNREHITPKFINQQILKWFGTNILKPTSDGLQLSEVINYEDIPNSDNLTAYYNNVLAELPSILNTDHQKTIRILESAAYLGSDFDIKILADLWKIDLLDLLDYFSILENKDLAEDVPGKDNQYAFIDPNFILALKNYFGEQSQTKQHRKQIVIEYHKRWINLRLSNAQSIEIRTTDELQELLAKFELIRHSEEMKELYRRVITNIAIRLFLVNEFQKMRLLLDRHGEFMDRFLLNSLKNHMYFWEFKKPINEDINDYGSSQSLKYWKAINALLQSGLNDDLLEGVNDISAQDITNSELDYCLKIIVKDAKNFENYISNSSTFLKSLNLARSRYAILLDFKILTSSYNIGHSQGQKINFRKNELIKLIENGNDSSFDSFASLELNNYFLETDDHLGIGNLLKLMVSKNKNRVDNNWVDFILSVNHKTFDDNEFKVYMEQLNKVEQYLKIRNLDQVLSETSFRLLMAQISVLRKSGERQDAIKAINQFINNFNLREMEDSISKTYLVKLLIEEKKLYSDLKEYAREKELLDSAYHLVSDLNDSIFQVEVLLELAKFARIHDNNPQDCLKFMKEALDVYNRNPVLNQKSLGLLYFQTAQAFLALEKWDEALDYYLLSKTCWAQNEIGQFRNFITDCRALYCIKHGNVQLPDDSNFDIEEVLNDVRTKIDSKETELWQNKYGGAAAIKDVRPYLL